MGQEITKNVFTREDEKKFAIALHEETALFRKRCDDSAFSSEHGVGGFELEAWLVDEKFSPAPLNKKFLQKIDNPLLCAELALFNVELNSEPRKLTGQVLTLMEKDLDLLLSDCEKCANQIGTTLTLAGILPTVMMEDLCIENMSSMNRYRVLNDEIVKLRDGAEHMIEIEGEEHISVRTGSVMFEAATTALQLQFQVAFEKSLRFYNTSIALSGPMLAISANSPYLFGALLWDETRIPLFEQSLSFFQASHAGRTKTNRVTLGTGYARSSVAEVFEENLKSHRVLLPMMLDEPKQTYPHMRLHGGTVWRWNRPLAGIDSDGTPHIRIEHRVPPSGPTISDMVANAALFYGALQHYGSCDESLESRLPFETVSENFYNCARESLAARISWLSPGKKESSEIIMENILPVAHEGLCELGVDKSDRDHYLGIIKNRAESGQNGAVWQKEFVKKHRCSMKELLAEYIKNQREGNPVHEWSI